MAPEAKKTIENFRDYVLETQGATPDAINILKELWQGAVDKKDIDQSTAIGQEIGPKRSLHDDLTSSVQEVINVLIKHGLDKIDIPISNIQSAIFEALEPTAFIPKKEDEDMWRTNTDALILGMVIEKNNSGEFAHNDLVDIGLSCMKEDFRQKKESRTNASIRAAIAKRRFAVRVYNAYKKSGCTIGNMKELIEAEVIRMTKKDTFKLSLVANGEWRKVYKTIIDEYGDMTPKDFVIKVLSRFKESTKLEELFIDIVEESSAFSEKTLISNEVVEIILGNIFLNNEIVNNLLREIMTDETSEQIKKQFGFYLSRVPKEKIRQFQEQAISNRSKKEISKEEHNNAIKLICFAIEKLTTEGKRGWSKIPKTKDRLSLKLLYIIASNAKGKCFEIQNILFPRIEVTTQHDFIVRQRRKI